MLQKKQAIDLAFVVAQKVLPYHLLGLANLPWLDGPSGPSLLRFFLTVVLFCVVVNICALFLFCF
jgi:hypothetical protein